MLKSLWLLLGLVAGLATPGAAADQWHLAETEHFRIYGDLNPDRLREQALLLERFDLLLRRVTGIPEEKYAPKLDVYLVGDEKTLHEAHVMPQMASGIYRAVNSGIAAFAVRDSGGEAREDVLLHEYAHHFMMQHFPYPYPGWYVEGFAEYVMTANIEDNVVELGLVNDARASWLGYGGWMSFDELLFGDPGEFSGNDVARYYAQSWLLVHYLLRDAERSQMLGNYLAALAAGEDPRAAYETHFDRSISRLTSDLHSYIRRGMRYSRIDFGDGLPTSSDVTVARLPGSVDDLMLPYAALRTGASEREALLVQIREGLSKWQGDPYAAVVEAGVEAQFGDAARGRNLVMHLIKTSPDDPELYYLLGRAHSRLAHIEGYDTDEHHALARRSYAKAYQLRPDHYQTMLYYVLDGESLAGQQVRDILAEIRALAPQISYTSYLLAWALANDGEFERAEAVLAPVVHNVHNRTDTRISELYTLIKNRSSEVAQHNTGVGRTETHEGEIDAQDGS